MKKKLLLLGCVLVSCSVFANRNNKAVDSSKIEKEFPFSFTVSYIGDFAGNVGGGQKDGFGYLGYGTLGLSFSTEKAGWWKGGELVLSGASTHGTCPSENWIGDFQVANNIEAGNHAFLQELYFSQILGPVEIIAGLQDFNATYAYTDKAGLFLNSSFGINSVLSSAFGVPIFPITSWGLSVKWDITNWVNWQVGAFDSPFDFDENPYNVHWRFIPEKGSILSTEFTFTTNIHDELEGSYRVGMAYQTTLNKIEFHAAMEQMFWRRDERNMSVFLMAAYAPKLNENYANFAAGFNFTGVFSPKGKDMLGLAFSTALFDNKYKQETAIELTYQYAFNEHFYIQPDFQYILNPAGLEYAGQQGKNTLFMALRFGIDF